MLHGRILNRAHTEIKQVALDFSVGWYLPSLRELNLLDALDMLQLFERRLGNGSRMEVFQNLDGFLCLRLVAFRQRKLFGLALLLPDNLHERVIVLLHFLFGLA